MLHAHFICTHTLPVTSNQITLALFDSHIYMTALGVLCCFALFVCLTLLAFFLPSHLSFIYVYVNNCVGEDANEKHFVLHLINNYEIC